MFVAGVCDAVWAGAPAAVALAVTATAVPDAELLRDVAIVPLGVVSARNPAASGTWMLAIARPTSAAAPFTERNPTPPGAGITMPWAAASDSIRCVSVERRDGLSQHLVLGLKARGPLDRAADARAELQHLDLHRHDPDEHHAEERNPGAAADQAVKQPMIGERPDELERARPERHRRCALTGAAWAQ